MEGHYGLFGGDALWMLEYHPNISVELKLGRSDKI